MTAERLDVGAARTEEHHVVFGAPGDVLAEIQRIRLVGEAAVASEKARERELLLPGEEIRLNRNERGRQSVIVHMEPPSIQPDLHSHHRSENPGTIKHDDRTTRPAEPLPSGHSVRMSAMRLIGDWRPRPSARRSNLLAAGSVRRVTTYRSMELSDTEQRT